MANGVKYSTGSTPAGCLRKGNMLLAVGQQDYGTSFYSGVNPPAGGYTIYVNKATSGPSIHCPRTDAELIRLTNQIAGANYTTTSQCFSYLASQSDKIIVDLAYPDIATSGLLLKLDSSFTASYPKTGTTWYDISGNSSNGVIYNGPIWNSNGYFEFDGIDDYVDTNKTFQFTRDSQFSVCGFINIRDHKSRASAAAGIIGKGHWYSNSWDVWLSNDNRIYFETNGNSNPNNVHFLYSDPLTIDRWYFFTAIYENGRKLLYLNHSQYENFDGGVGDFTNNNSVLISRRYDDVYRSLMGYGANYSIYDRQLEETEVFQNYYGGNIALDGLVLSVDGANIVSYPGTGSTWYDMTQSEYSVTNCNIQKSKNNYYSLWSNGNDADVASSPILNNDYHSVELLLMFKGSATYPNGYTGSWEQFFGYFSAGSDRSPGVWRFPSARLIHWQYAPGFNGPNFGKNSANDEFDLNTYYHIVVTKEGGTVKTYINGVLTNTVGASNPKTAGDSIIRFFDYYSADLMEIQVCRIYERTISQDEVSLNYAAVKNRM